MRFVGFDRKSVRAFLDASELKSVSFRRFPAASPELANHSTRHSDCGFAGFGLVCFRLCPPIRGVRAEVRNPFAARAKRRAFAPIGRDGIVSGGRRGPLSDRGRDSRNASRGSDADGGQTETASL